MSRRRALVLLVVFLAAPLGAVEPDPKALEAMQGTWTMLSFKSNGDEVAADTIVTWQRVVSGKHVIWKEKSETFLETDFSIDASKTPMTLDSTIATGDAKGQTMLAIYELKDDVLRVCFAPPGNPRPSTFDASSGTGHLMFTAKRLSR